MPTYKKRPPFLPLPPSTLQRVWTPSAIGALTAALLTAYPEGLEPVLKHLVRLQDIERGPQLWAYTLLIGFAVGYGVTKAILWLRWKALSYLFAYQGWVTNPGSYSSKLWGLALKLCLPAPPYTTYQFQQLLPRQPLPTLHHTLDLYLKVSKQLLTQDEFEVTTKLVEEFRYNEGPKLQKYLEERTKKTINWLSDYWMTAAYLTSRQPLFYSNYYQSNSIGKHRTKDQLVRAACLVNIFHEYEELCATHKLQPVMVQDMVPLCMDGYRRIFNTCRVPGEQMDTIATYPGKRHIVVIRKGHYFLVNLVQPDSNGTNRKLTVEEIKIQLQAICELAENREEVAPVAALTGQNRTLWAKQRRLLAKQNQAALEAVESAMFLLVLDHRTPKNLSERSKFLLTGHGENRWFDKSITVSVFPDASEGSNVEHSVMDAMVWCTVGEYQLCYEEYKDGDVVKDPRYPPRQLPQPKEINWSLEGMHDMIDEAAAGLRKLIDDVDLLVIQAEYGKGFMKKCRMSPDAYIQMALQLAWYREYKNFTKTYEPSTGRFYQLGRTETVHSGTRQCTKWVRSMMDPSADREERVDLLRQAVKAQTDFRLKATVGRGCDRHLLGLYCAARELGMDVPAIFRDKAWTMPFKLSTSQTPTAVYEYHPDFLFDDWSGGFCPTAHDGYGVAYIIMGGDILLFMLTSWKSCEDTGSARFGAALLNALVDMKKLLS